MAGPVYDDEKDLDLDSLSPSELGNLEDQHSTKQDQKEDELVGLGADPGRLSRGGMGRKLREHSEAADEEKEQELNQGLQDEWQKAKAGDEAAGKSFYKPGWQKNKSFIKTLRNRRRLLIGAGVASSLIISVVFVLFSFLNVFKLDDIMSNIDLKSFSRFNSATNQRSDKWIQSYLTLRLMQLKGNGADPDSQYFRANKVDTNNPIRDWYHTLQTSGFEADLAKQGIVFVNQPAGNGFTFSVLKVDGTQIAGLSAADVRNGNLLNELKSNSSLVKEISSQVDLTKPGGNKEARAKIRQIVNETSDSGNVIRRRQIRKDIQNMLGVRDWKFFETTRDKASKTKTDIRNKIIVAALPDNSKTGELIKCLFGISNCQFSDDPSASSNQDAEAITGSEGPDNTTTVEDQPPGSATSEVAGTVDLGPAADVVKQVIGKVTPVLDVVNIASTLDALSSVNKAIDNGELSKGVEVAKGLQDMGLYQVLETSSDQLKTGQVTSAEVGKFMQVLGPVAASEGWQKVIAGKGDPSQLNQSAAAKNYCSAKSQAELNANPDLATTNPAFEFTYACPNKQIGGGSNALTLETDYKATVGPVLGQILDAYSKVRNAPIIGTITNVFESISNIFSGLLTDVLKSVLAIVGLDGDLKSVVQYMVATMASFLGAGPITPNSAGDFLNLALQGGSYTAEATARANGASLTTPVSEAASQEALNQYMQQQTAQESLTQRYLSLNNPVSPASHIALAVSNFKPSSVSSLLNVGSLFKSIGSNFAMIFSHKALAATDNGYSAAQFAGIKTYDYPPQCYSLNPLTQEPQDGTNIQAILGPLGVQVPTANLTWELVANSTNWYAYVDSEVGKVPGIGTSQTGQDQIDKITEQIYNCNLLDNAVRGGLGYVYGYTADNGLN